ARRGRKGARGDRLRGPGRRPLARSLRRAPRRRARALAHEPRRAGALARARPARAAARPPAARDARGLAGAAPPRAARAAPRRAAPLRALGTRRVGQTLVDPKKPLPRPDWVRRINDEGRMWQAIGLLREMVPLDRDSLLDAARASTGLADFGD